MLEKKPDKQTVYGCPYDTADFMSAVAALGHVKREHSNLPVRVLRITKEQNNVRK